MAHNALVRADLAAWSAAIPVEPAEFRALDLAQYQSINGDDGGTWAPAAPVIVGGYGLNLSGALHRVISGGTLGVASGGNLMVYSGGLAGISGALEVNSGGAIHWYSGSSATVDSGATVTVSSGGAISAAGTVSFASGGLLHLLSGSSATVNSGASINAAGGISMLGAAAVLTIGTGASLETVGDVNIHGELNVGYGSPSGGVLAIAGAGSLYIGATATGTIEGILTQSGIGRFRRREFEFTTDANQTLSSAVADHFWISNGILSTTRVWAVSAGIVGETMTVSNRDYTQTISLNNVSGGTIDLGPNSAGNLIGVMLECTSDGWFPVGGYRRP